MLGENVPFPVPEAMRDQAPGSYQHHVVGLGAPESIVPERSDPTKK